MSEPKKELNKAVCVESKEDSTSYEINLPLGYHREGVVYHLKEADLAIAQDMIDTIIDTGFHALHPIEPESTDIDQLRDYVGKRLCLVGNIRVHTLSVGTPEEIRSLVADRIKRFGHQGAYCVGASNSVPNYVSLENYKAMLQASADFGKIPT